jgi:hypothetical protein
MAVNVSVDNGLLGHHVDNLVVKKFRDFLFGTTSINKDTLFTKIIFTTFGFSQPNNASLIKLIKLISFTNRIINTLTLTFISCLRHYLSEITNRIRVPILSNTAALNTFNGLFIFFRIARINCYVNI